MNPRVLAGQIKIGHVYGDGVVDLTRAQEILALLRAYKTRSSIGKNQKARSITLWEQAIAQALEPIHAEALREAKQRWAVRTLVRQHLGGAKVETCDNCLALIAPGDWCYGYGIGGGVAFACYACGNNMQAGR